MLLYLLTLPLRLLKNPEQQFAAKISLPFVDIADGVVAAARWVFSNDNTFSWKLHCEHIFRVLSNWTCMRIKETEFVLVYAEQTKITKFK